jgi:hypothetical protein
LIFREESIIARAKQILEVEGDSGSIIKKNFFSRIAKYHPDKCGPPCTEQAKLGVRYEDWLKETFYDFVKPE